MTIKMGVMGRILKSHDKDGIKVIDAFRLNSVSVIGENDGKNGRSGGGIDRTNKGID